ncbi:trypsin-like peptidase domain-containing protein [Mycobacterium aquaticum]|uniref:Serine protease n=1 Tax=Mycobacterium aquaticum TaxID=1927124 RepID=A0A1X0AH16_9MYCO|nr:trypsin-like peptidase domain-containing protein [Mycobacterium aquaticum]ORA29339.1 hypothetical protein BST13_27275 [Mycobacterium aquaticum]
MNTARLAARAIATTASMVIAASTAPAAAAVQLVEPGDRIETATNACTLGWVYIGADKHTYAVTAGHCATTPGETVTDKHSGAIGTFLQTRVDPPGIGGADYALIDFGVRTLPVPFVANQPVTANNHTEPRPGQKVCRDGISTGTVCGEVTRSYGQHQYITVGMTPTIGGDSGGPVWTTDTDGGDIRVIGIWLGGRTTIAGGNFGRFAGLSDALAVIGTPPITAQ